ncbi:MAG: hypothetical protein ABFS17_08055 [Chloroflexota bacterium]
MPDRNRDHQERIDQILSDFADQVIGSDHPNAVPLSDDQQINLLQATVLRLNQHAPTSASPESSEKIKKNLDLAWEKQHRNKISLFSRIREALKPAAQTRRYQSATRRRQQTALRISAAAIIVLIAAFVFLPDSGISGGATSGAAAGDLNPWIIAGGLALLGGIALWWWIKSRRN